MLPPAKLSSLFSAMRRHGVLAAVPCLCTAKFQSRWLCLPLKPSAPPCRVQSDRAAAAVLGQHGRAAAAESVLQRPRRAFPYLLDQPAQPLCHVSVSCQPANSGCHGGHANQSLTSSVKPNLLLRLCNLSAVLIGSLLACCLGCILRVGSPSVCLKGAWTPSPMPAGSFCQSCCLWGRLCEVCEAILQLGGLPRRCPDGQHMRSAQRLKCPARGSMPGQLGRLASRSVCGCTAAGACWVTACCAARGRQAMRQWMGRSRRCPPAALRSWHRHLAALSSQ